MRAFLLCIPYSSKSSFYFNRLCAKGPLNVMKRVFPVLSYFSPIQNALNVFSFLRFSVQYFLIFFYFFLVSFTSQLYFRAKDSEEVLSPYIYAHKKEFLRLVFIFIDDCPVGTGLRKMQICVQTFYQLLIADVLQLLRLFVDFRFFILKLGHQKAFPQTVSA